MKKSMSEMGIHQTSTRLFKALVPLACDSCDASHAYEVNLRHVRFFYVVNLATRRMCRTCRTLVGPGP